jgi:molecular chaperone DnaJ
MVIRVAGAGDVPVSGKGPTGDLLVRVNISPSKVFRRQGTNIYHDTQIPIHSAILGGRVRVPTLEGDVDVRVPSGTQPGEECVLRGRGIPSLYGGERGDLYVTFSLKVPRLAFCFVVIGTH